MNIALNRRCFLQTAGAAGAALSLGALVSAEPARKFVSATPNGDKLGWRLSNTCYTFNSLCFFDAVEKTVGLNIRYVEGFHLKDIDVFGKVDAEEVPWGTGKSDIEGILKEIHRQGIKPVVAIEYERQGDTLSVLRQCIAFYEKTAVEVGG